MTITVTDTNTGQALTVTAVAAELARQDGTELHIAQDAVIRPVLQLEHAVAEAQAWRDMADWCRNWRNGHWHEQELRQAEPEHVWAELPPDPALQLAPDRLDAEQAAREARTETLRRRTVLKAAVDRTPVPPAKPFVARVPWRIRVKRVVVGYLEQVKREKAM